MRSPEELCNPRCIEVVDDRVAAILRTKTPGEKLQIANRMWHSARRLALSGIRHHHPEWSPDQVHHELRRRFLSGSI